MRLFMAPTQGEIDLRWWREVLENPQFVYVIQGDRDRDIKVGVSHDPLARMRGLQTGTSQELRLLYVLPGGYKLEANLHQRLRGARLRNEWFGGPDIDRFLEWVKEYAFQARRHFRKTGELLSVTPSTRPVQRTPIRTGGYDAKIGHTWRTGNEDQAPVTVRFVEPNPVPRTQEAIEAEERCLRAGYTKRGRTLIPPRSS